jgi:hypothetical protein
MEASSSDPWESIVEVRRLHEYDLLPPPPDCYPARAHSIGSSTLSSLARLDRYADLECIGTGHHSRVFRARHTRTGAMVALKKVVVFEIPSKTERSKCLQVVLFCNRIVVGLFYF